MKIHMAINVKSGATEATIIEHVLLETQINLIGNLDEEEDVDQDVDELYFSLLGWDNLFEDFTG